MNRERITELQLQDYPNQEDISLNGMCVPSFCVMEEM